MLSEGLVGVQAMKTPPDMPAAWFDERAAQKR